MADIAPAAEFNFMKTKVVKHHHATDETQLELRLDDIVYVLEQDDSGWWGGHKEGEDCTGWFPGSCVRETLDEEAAEGVTDQQAAGPVMVSPPRCPITSVEGLDLDAASPLHRDNRLVASPNRRVSAGNPLASDTHVPSDMPIADSAASVPSIAGSAASVPPLLIADSTATALVNLQEEYRIAKEQHTLEIKNLQDQLTDADANTVRANSARWRTEDLERQCQSLKKEKEELQTRMQELSTQLEAFSSEKSALQEQLRTRSSETNSLQEQLSRAYPLQEQLTKSQQESRDSINECAQLRRLLQETKAELLKVKESVRPTQEPVREPSKEPVREHPPQRRVVEGEMPRSSPPPRVAESKTPPLGDDARRRLFPSTADPSLAGMPATEKDLSHAILNVTAEEVSSASLTMETVPRLSERMTAFNAFRQPPQPPAGGRQAPAGSAPRPGRSNSLTRPAFRPSPCASSPSMHLSPSGMAKCVSSGILPDTPSRIAGESEIPPVGSVKEMARLFEQRCSTPDRSRNEGTRPATDGDLSLRGLATLRGQRSPVTEQRGLRENPNSARSLPRQPVKSDEALPRVQNLIGLDMQEVEDAGDFQVNFNMSPMKRHA